MIHEWAHVQRRDDSGNLAHADRSRRRRMASCRVVARAALLIEREIACDETVVAVTGVAKRYAACLASLATLPSWTPLEPMAVGALSSAALTRASSAPVHASSPHLVPAAAASRVVV